MNNTTMFSLPNFLFCFGIALYIPDLELKNLATQKARRFRYTKLQQKPTISRQKIGKRTNYQYTKHLDNSHTTTVKHHLHPCQQRPSGELRLPPSPGCHPKNLAKAVEMVKYIAGTFIPDVW